MKAWSLRTKLALWSAFVTALVLLTFGAGAAVSLYFRQTRTIEKSLVADSKVFFRELSENGKPSDDDMEEAVLLLKGTAPLYGLVFGRAHGAPSHVYPESLRALVGGWPLVAGFSTVKLGKKELMQGVFVDGEFVLMLVADLHPARDMVGDLMRDYLLALPFVLLVGATGSWWFARRALQPIANITRAAEAITAERLDARLPVPLSDDEIGRLTHVLNAMFDRLQRGFEQATRFTADASHELRTPLTILRGEIEEALRSDQFNGEQEKLLIELLEQTSSLQKIADDLLLLARFDAGKSTVLRDPVDLSTLVGEAGEDAELLAAPGQIRIHLDVMPNICVPGDAHLLRRLLLNLIDNAVRYNRTSGEVRLTLGREGPDAVFRIANTGSGIPEDRRGELFQRFFRLNVDRNRSTGGSGLGLSLCREIAVAHQGRIVLSRSEHDCTEFIVYLSRQ
jgi:signal transduction histidine kinase